VAREQRKYLPHPGLSRPQFLKHNGEVMAKKRVLVVMRVMHAGGGATLNVWSLARNIAAHTNWEVTLLTAPKTGAPPLRVESQPGLDVQMLRTRRNMLVDRIADCWPVDFAREFEALAHTADFVHFHSLWRYPTRRGCPVLRAQGVPYMIAPRGTLDPWALRYRGLRKRLAFGLHERSNLAGAACLHATAKSELDHFRTLGFSGPVAVVPNGVAQEALQAFSGAGSMRGEGRRRKLLFVSRLHPKKRVKELLIAWATLAPDFPDWELEVVGQGEAKYENELREALRGSLAVQRTSFRGHLSGAPLWEAYQAADLFVLPTHTENFGSVIAEALAAGLPVITTTGTPWEGLETRRCGWWRDLDREPLADVLRAAMLLTEAERREMGARGREWVLEEFAWPSIACKTAEVYEWVLAGAERHNAPTCVQFGSGVNENPG